MTTPPTLNFAAFFPAGVAVGGPENNSAEIACCGTRSAARQRQAIENACLARRRERAAPFELFDFGK
jgi:hypothetical protein